jgi:peptidoglycan/xylan/chitin deacetylase (PgdA/CDA1 family)
MTERQAITRGQLLAAGAAAAGVAGVAVLASSDGSSRTPQVALSYDGGWESVHSTGLPLFRRHGLAATVYVTTGYIDGTTLPLVPERPMTWSQIEDLDSAGWEISSHTRTHPRLSEVSPDQLQDEVVGAKQVLVEHGFPAQGFAYPFSNQDAAVRALVMRHHAYARAGYQLGTTVPPIHSRAELSLLPVTNTTNLTAAEMIALTERSCLHDRSDLIWLGHIIGPPVRRLAVRPDALDGYLAWLAARQAEGRLAVATVLELVRGNLLET